MKATVTQKVIVTLSQQEVTELILQHLNKHGKELAPNCNVKWDDAVLEIYMKDAGNRNFSVSAIVNNQTDNKEVVTNPIYSGKGI